ncbi:hypothetical protein MMC15_004901 [Xylographa vitiligo]|nr:hypothetical protein [Xylographa vitiligo]
MAVSMEAFYYTSDRFTPTLSGWRENGKRNSVPKSNCKPPPPGYLLRLLLSVLNHDLVDSASAMDTGKATTMPARLSLSTTKGPSDPSSTTYGDLSHGVAAKDTRTTWHNLPPEIKRKVALLLPSTMDLVHLMQYDLDLCSILSYSFNLRVNALPVETKIWYSRALLGGLGCFELMVADRRLTLCPSVVTTTYNTPAGSFRCCLLSQTGRLAFEF